MRDSPLDFAILGDHLRWMNRGYCNGITDWHPTFFAAEIPATRGIPAEPTTEAQRMCGACVVRVECLDWALKHDEHGVWGGTTREQRKAMARPIVRAKCPACQGAHLIRAESQQVCGDCGASWLAVKVHGNASAPVPGLDRGPAVVVQLDNRRPQPRFVQPPLFEVFALAVVKPAPKRVVRRRRRTRVGQLPLPGCAA